MAPPIVLKAAATGPGRSIVKWLVYAALIVLLLPVLIVVTILGPAGNEQAQTCPDSSAGPGDPIGAEIGALGGISGTGITRVDLRTVRAGRTPSIAAGNYMTTAYGPPWGGIQGAGIATAGGLRINGGAPKKYFIAVDPALISLGSWVYVWPNPFKWKGPFLAADTGGAIDGRRIDFYDWRGRTTQNGWGRTAARASAKPFLSGELPDVSQGPLLSGDQDVEAVPVSTTPSSDPDSPCSENGIEVGGSGAGRQAVKIAVSHLGKNAYNQPFSGFQPTTVSYFWCSWFVSNAWRLAGVKVGTLPFTGGLYNWAAQGHPELVLKRVGVRAKTLKLPVGTALFYGTSPAAPATSSHVNMVRSVNPDGTVMIIGGNQGNSRVTTYGPCRIRNGALAYLSGPGCDGRSIYGMVAPSLDSTDNSAGDDRT